MRIEKVSSWAELTASIAVVATLVLLVQEVRANTLALERQSRLDRVSSLAVPFFEGPQLADILGTIKSVDGPDPMPQALVERYGLTYEEASVWERHLWLVWSGAEADFLLTGETEGLRALIAALKSNPDNEIYLESSSFRHSSAFWDYVNRVPALPRTDGPG